MPKVPQGIRHYRYVAEHASYPTNPKLAELMYQAGYIEKYGTGTGEIFKLARKAGLKEPKFDLARDFKMTIWRPKTQQVPGKHRTSQEVERLVTLMEGEMKRSEIQEIVRLKHRDNFIEKYLQPSISEGLIELTNPRQT